MIAFFTILLLINETSGLLGYDCGGTSLNVTTISLLDVGECRPPDEKVNSTSAYIQLLQVAEYSQIGIISCRVEIDRHIFHCGMHSHVSLVQGSHRRYLVDLDQGSCAKIHATRTFTYGLGNAVIDLFPNQTNYRTLTLAGTTSMDGSCKGSQFSDPYGTWNDVIVEASLYITFRDYNAVVKTNQDRLILKSGTHCKTSDLTCIDEDGANVYWAPLPSDTCKFHSYDVLYQGSATRIFDSGSRYPIVYSLASETMTFALSKKSERTLCGYTLIQTEHPKLIIVETSKQNPFAKQSKVLVDNLDAFTYVNSKFIYVEKHLKGQIQTLYRNVIAQKCKLEQQILKNAVALAQSQPDMFAYTIMKGPGYIATIAGEVAHIVKCIPIETTRRSTEECYIELPIFLRNESYFLTPKSRIVIRTGTVVECNPLLPIMYRLKGGWMSLTPKPAAVLPPQTLEPLTKPSWKYVDAEHLAESGIYSTDDLNRLREHIMFPVEQPTLINNLAKAAAGHRVPLNGLNLANLLDENAINAIAEPISQKFFNGILQFGTYSAAFIGAWMIVKAFKVILDTIIHGYTLHSIYGWSVHLLGAIFSSVTSLLIHLGKKPATSSNDNNRQNEVGEQNSRGDVTIDVELTTTKPYTPGDKSAVPSASTHASYHYPHIGSELAALSQSLTNLEQRVNTCQAKANDQI